MPLKIFNGLKTTLDRKNAIAYAGIRGIVRIYANFWICGICGIIFAYAIVKMPLYAEKYAICRFLQRALQFFAGIILTDNTFLPINLAAGHCRYTKLTLTKQVNYTERPLVGHIIA